MEELALLNSLRRKYGATLEEVLAFGEEATARADDVERLLTGPSRSKTSWLKPAVTSITLARGLRSAAAGGRLAKAARGHLRQLGFTDPHLEVEVSPAQAGSRWGRGHQLLFASDSRLVPSEVGRVASGGELSRLILALRLAGGAAEPRWSPSTRSTPASVADGVGPGAKLAELATDRQVLASPISPRWRRSPTPMPSSAAKGPSATVELVDGAERLEELSRMLSGLPESERGREHAEELLAIAAGGLVE